MAGLIPDNILEDILSRIDIVELIQGYIPLKKAGRNFRALCPFHHEKTPSFMVSPDRQIYHCFGCGESGNAFRFLVRYERLDFREAVEFLAKKAGVQIPQTAAPNNSLNTLYTELYRINEEAVLFYQNSLNASEQRNVKEYLQRRGLNDATIKLFKLGYAPNQWDSLLNHLRAKGNNLGLLEKGGLLVVKEQGGYRDRFHNRIIFPIFDVKGRVLGFGGRVMDSSLPKYINSPETPIYTKGKNLYGLNFSKDAIRDADYAIIVEGYLDCILPYQHGIRNIVASQGTALTADQARNIKRYTHNVVMVFDPDTAGETATLRSLDIFIEEAMNVKVVTLSPGNDPDLFVRKNGPEVFKAKIREAEPLFDYKIKVLKGRYGSKGIEPKARIASEMLETVSKFKNAILRSEYTKKLADELNIREDALLEELKSVKPQRNYSLEQAAIKETEAVNPTEKLLVKLMLQEQDLLNRIRESLVPTDFSDERLGRLVSLLFEFSAAGKTLDTRMIINHFNDDALRNLICESTFLPEDSEEDRYKIVDDCIRRLKARGHHARKISLHEQIKLAQDSGDEHSLKKLVQEFHRLAKVQK